MKSRTADTLSGDKKKDVRQYSQRSPRVHTQVKEKSTCWFNMPPLGTVVLCGGREKGPHGQSFANPARWCSPVCPVWWKSNIDSTMFQMTVWGSESGLTFSNVDLFFFNNIYNTLHSNVFILPYKFPMITSLKHSESFSWDIIIYKDLPFCCEEGPCMFKKFMEPLHLLRSVSVLLFITGIIENEWSDVGRTR